MFYSYSFSSIQKMSRRVFNKSRFTVTSTREGAQRNHIIDRSPAKARPNAAVPQPSPARPAIEQEDLPPFEFEHDYPGDDAIVRQTWKSKVKGL